METLRPTAGQGNAAVVFNALDHFGTSRLRTRIGSSNLWSHSDACRELDLRHYFEVPRNLADALHDVDLLWVVGGNAFVLARAIAQSRLRSTLSEVARRRPFIYAGYSAGACVARPDLTAIDLIDDPTQVPEGYDAGVPFECLGLVAYRVVPHWRSPHPESERATMVANRLGEEGLSFRCLTDGEALISEVSADLLR